MTKDQARWVKRLKRCLKDMPDDIEILVSYRGHSESDIIVLPTGKVEEISQADNYDVFTDFHQYRDNALCSFISEQIFADSESI